MPNTLKAEYTKGNIVATMLKTSIAMLASTIAVSGYNVADTFFVGQLRGAEPLAAMGFTFPVVMLVGCIFMGIGAGCMATIGQAVGRGDRRETSNLVSAGMLLVIIIAVLLALIGVFTADIAFGAMGAHGPILALVKSYMNIWFLGCVTMGISNEGNKILIAMGRPRSSSAMTMLGMLINVVLDPLLIFGGARCGNALIARSPSSLGWLANTMASLMAPFPECGIRGAAIATVLSQAVAAVVIIVLLLHLHVLELERIPIATLLSTWKKIVTYAIPATLGSILMPVSNYVTTWTTASFGTTVVAAVAAGGKLEILAWMYPMSFGISIMPVISQNYGARLYSRVRRCFNFSVLVATIYLCFASAIIMTFPHKFVIYFSTEPEVQELMVTYMRIIPWGFVLLELTRYCGNALTGCGHPNMDAALKVFRMAIVLIPLSVLTRQFHWLPGIFYSRLASDVLGGGASLCITYYYLHKLPKQDGLPDRKE